MDKWMICVETGKGPSITGKVIPWDKPIETVRLTDYERVVELLAKARPCVANGSCEHPRPHGFHNDLLAEIDAALPTPGEK